MKDVSDAVELVLGIPCEASLYSIVSALEEVRSRASWWQTIRKCVGDSCLTELSDDEKNTYVSRANTDDAVYLVKELLLNYRAEDDFILSVLSVLNNIPTGITQQERANVLALVQSAGARSSDLIFAIIQKFSRSIQGLIPRVGEQISNGSVFTYTFMNRDDVYRRLEREVETAEHILFLKWHLYLYGHQATASGTKDKFVSEAFLTGADAEGLLASLESWTTTLDEEMLVELRRKALILTETKQKKPHADAKSLTPRRLYFAHDP